MAPKFTASMVALAPIILPALQMVKPKRICEVGSAAGYNSKFLYDFLRPYAGELIMIDPAPRTDNPEWVHGVNDNAHLIQDFSLNAIPKVATADMWFVDGDHNWYTVYHELLLIDKLSQENNSPTIIFLHDVAWPCGRRDMYCDPSTIPAEFVHPYSSREQGLILNEGARGVLKGQHWALKEGGPRNGVVTAVEDFARATTTQYYWIFIPAFLGLGILINAKHPLAGKMTEYYAPYHNNELMMRLESDRTANYLTAALLHEEAEAVAE